MPVKREVLALLKKIPPLPRGSNSRPRARRRGIRKILEDNGVRVIPETRLKELRAQEDIRSKRLKRKAELARNSRKQKREKMQKIVNENDQLQARVTELEDLVGRFREKFGVETPEEYDVKMTERSHVNPHQPQPSFFGAGAGHIAHPIPPQQRDFLDPLQMASASLEQLSHSIVTQEQRLHDTVQLCQLSPTDFLGDAQTLLQSYLGQLFYSYVAKEKELHAIAQSAVTNHQTSPCVTFLRWVSWQDASFFENPQGLWKSLVGEEHLRLSPEQQMQFQRCCQSIIGVVSREHIRHVNVEMKFISEVLRAEYESLRMGLDHIRTILSDEQSSRLFHWIVANKLCVKMMYEK